MDITKKSNKFKKIIISTGSTSADCEKFLNKKNNSKYSWYSIPIWGMKNKKKQIKKLYKYNEIITFENHMQVGGLGSWINEILSLKKVNNRVNILNKFISSNVIGKVGSENYLNKIYGPK